MKKIFLFLIAATFPFFSIGFAQGLKLRSVVNKQEQIKWLNEENKNSKTHFVLKFTEGTRIRLQNNDLIFNSTTLSQKETALLKRNKIEIEQIPKELNAVVSLLTSNSLQFGYMMGGAPVANDLLKEESEKLSNEELADMNLYYLVSSKEENKPYPYEILMELLNYAIVETAYPLYVAREAGFISAEKTLPSPDLSPNQTYLNPAPEGIDAIYAWSRPGGYGNSNITIFDVESKWRTDHEDFPAVSWGGNSIWSGGDIEHGTAVIGVVAARHNSIGVKGIAPQCRIGLSSVWRLSVAPVGDAIWEAGRAARRGDIIIIEQHAPGPGDRYICMEYWQDCFDAIHFATARGTIVVEAAGNGGANLDDPLYGNRFQKWFRNSRAIMVGAGMPGSRSPFEWSCFGSRVDVQGWGSNVMTMGYGGGTPPMRYNGNDEKFWYTPGFDGTSSASPIIAGAIACIQSVRLGESRSFLSADEMRLLLKHTGQPQATSTSHIGELPNLRLALESLNSPATFNRSGIYRIININSNKALEVKNYSRENGGEICQWDFHGGDNQLWRILSGTDGYVHIRSVLSNKDLEIYQFSTADGGRLAQWDYTGAANQQWRIDRLPDGTYMLVNRHSVKVAEVYGLSTANGGTMVQWDSWMGSNQKFRIERVR